MRCISALFARKEPRVRPRDWRARRLSQVEAIIRQMTYKKDAGEVRSGNVGSFCVHCGGWNGEHFKFCPIRRGREWLERWRNA